MEIRGAKIARGLPPVVCIAIKRPVHIAERSSRALRISIINASQQLIYRQSSKFLY